MRDLGFPGGASGDESGCPGRRHRRCGLDPWVGKIPWRRAWQPTPVFLPGASYGRRSLTSSLHRVAELSTTEATWHTGKPIFSSACLCLFPRLSQVTCSNWFPCFQSVLHYLFHFFTVPNSIRLLFVMDLLPVSLSLDCKHHKAETCFVNHRISKA